jgi:hypothetical protein
LTASTAETVTRVTLKFECSICGRVLGHYKGEEFIIAPMAQTGIRILCLKCWRLIKDGPQ